MIQNSNMFVIFAEFVGRERGGHHILRWLRHLIDSTDHRFVDIFIFQVKAQNIGKKLMNFILQRLKMCSEHNSHKSYDNLYVIQLNSN